MMKKKMKNIIYVIVSTLYKKEIFILINAQKIPLKYGIGNTISNRPESTH
jgi:hypothetical protein